MEKDSIRLLIIAVVFTFLPSIRNIILLLAKLLWKILSELPGPKTQEMFSRYLNIGRYAFHKEQKTIISKLKSQYPPATRFVILPMDMDYMAAYKSKTRYRDQMKELAEVKSMESNDGLIYPFIFADPRRFVPVKEEKRSKPDDNEYFNYSLKSNKVILGNCFIKDYLEDKNFSGIKIYPALGYYPFDEKLLPLWKYAADNQIPIITHCIRGTIFYRGVKKKEWNEHPVFMQSMRTRDIKTIDQYETDGYETASQMESEVDVSEGYIPLVLPQASNVDFSYNFTHPLNYLCLLEEHLLRKFVSIAVQNDPNSPLIQLFGFNGEEKPLTHDLSKLKICLAHFGGEDEWKRYFEKDRYNYSSQLIKNPEKGIDFFKTTKKKLSPGKIEQLWNHTDWYSIICSMMLQYDNVYADISYILHGDKEILPLLKQTLQNPGLRDKVLFGTDFFVVRNHKSDKNMLADMLGGLSEDEFDCIARDNPERYLARK